MPFTVKQLADLAGVTVRTLHHYDKIGLLSPSSHTNKGYRLYHEDDLIQLQQILFYKELEFSLDEIKQLLQKDPLKRIHALKDQKNLMRLKKKRMERLIKSIDKTIQSMENKQQLSANELYDPFKDEDVKAYQQEVKDRWGKTNAYAQSMERVTKLSKKEMQTIKKEEKKRTQKIADLMEKGPQSVEVQEEIQHHYDGINFFYECSLDMYKNLADLYVSDPRFTAYYEKYKPGLAKFMQEAIYWYIKNRR